MLTGQELEHLRKVLRLRPGERITLFDDEGWEHEGVIRSYGARAGEIEIIRSYQADRESPLRVILAQALGKGEKVDWVVEKATELGVGSIVPFVSSRTVVRLDERKMASRLARWRKIALSAAKQSGRTRIPEILPLMDFAALVRHPWPCDLKLFFWEKESRQVLGALRGKRGDLNSLLVMIGPEGGFSPEEASEAMGQGFEPVGLGKRILRTETAAVAALSLVQFLWGDMG